MRQKEILSDTRIIKNTTSNDVVIQVQPADDMPECILVDLNLDSFNHNINNVDSTTGELIELSKNNKTDFDMFVDDRSGQLFISTEQSKNYSINETGHLIYTYR